MTFRGHVEKGVILLDAAPPLPDGTRVQVEVLAAGGCQEQPLRQGGQYAGQIWLAPDFDEWPQDLQEAFEMKP